MVGRESEIALLHEFLAPHGSRQALLVTGEAGIGKTTIWEEGISFAREGGIRVLSARPTDAEAQLSFATLGDLLREVGPAELAPLPSPQRYALEVALLRTEPGDTAPTSHATALAFLSTLTSLADQEPVVIAIDDVQWIDRASSEALVFATRRLRDARVRFLLAQRSGTSADLLQAFDAVRVEPLLVAPLSLGALRRLLFERLNLSLTRRALHRVSDAAGGNPLFALELGRAILERGAGTTGEELALPERVEELLGTRVAKLPAPLRRLLVAVALCPTVGPAELDAIADLAAIEEAADAGILVLDGDDVRASHPLLAAAALQRSSKRERREVHLALVGVVRDEQLRAKLLAGATTQPNAAIAAKVAAAAAGAERRGSLVDALQLTEHALRLSLPATPERGDRVLAVARFLALGGQTKRMVTFLASELDSLPRGAVTAEAFYALASEAMDESEMRRYLERALAENPNDRGMRAAATALVCLHEGVIQLRDLRGAERRLSEHLADAHLAGPSLEHEVLQTLSWINGLRGYSMADLCVRFSSVSPDRLSLTPIPEMVEGQRLVWRGDVAQARDLFTGLLTKAEFGARIYALNRLYLCDLALRSGDWSVAEHLLAEWEESSDGEEFVWPMYERCRAHLAAGRGWPEEAERWAAIAISRAEAAGGAWDLLEALRAQGIAALLSGAPGRAATTLRVVREHTQREGIDDPGAFPVAPDLVEALVELGELDEARTVTARLLELSELHEHTWGLITAKRCDALIRLTSDPADAARVDLTAAAAAYGAIGLRFDRARCLLALGRTERRSKKWRAARESLEDAAAAFDEIGSVGWAEQARSDLGRVSARRPRPKGALTPTEQRTAALAAQGLANKEIAAALFVTVHTVEVHLSRAYAKLGVRSRSQLAGRLATGADSR